jgi:hypothetical protein
LFYTYVIWCIKSQDLNGYVSLTYSLIPKEG